MDLTMAKPCPSVVTYLIENTATGLEVRPGRPFTVGYLLFDGLSPHGRFTQREMGPAHRLK